MGGATRWSRSARKQASKRVRQAGGWARRCASVSSLTPETSDRVSRGREVCRRGVGGGG